MLLPVLYLPFSSPKTTSLLCALTRDTFLSTSESPVSFFKRVSIMSHSSPASVASDDAPQTPGAAGTSLSLLCFIYCCVFSGLQSSAGRVAFQFQSCLLSCLLSKPSSNVSSQLLAIFFAASQSNNKILNVGNLSKQCIIVHQAHSCYILGAFLSPYFLHACEFLSFHLHFSCRALVSWNSLRILLINYCPRWRSVGQPYKPFTHR
jgi:hypothetical protein